MSDLISRQAAIDVIEAGRLTKLIDAETAVNGLKELPSAETEPNTGHWVSQRGGGYCCSECGRYALDEVDGNFIHVSFKSNFCPNCGANMRGREDE